MRKLQLKTMLLMLLMAVGGLSPAWADETRTLIYSNDFEGETSGWTQNGNAKGGWTVNPGTTTANTFVSKVIGCGSAEGDRGLYSPSFEISNDITLVDVELKFKMDACSSGKSSAIEFIQPSGVTIGNGYISSGNAFFRISASASGNGYWGTINVGETDYKNVLNTSGTYENNSLNRNTTGIVVLNARFNFTTKEATFTLKKTDGTTLVSSTTVAFKDITATSLKQIYLHAGKSYGGVTIDDVAVYAVETSETYANYTVHYVDNEKLKVKEDVVRAGVVGETVHANNDDMSTFYDGDIKYVYDNDGDGVEVKSDGTSELTVTYNKYEKIGYTVNATDGTNVIAELASGSAYLNDEVTIPYPRYFNVNGTLYSKNANNSEYRQTVAITESNQITNFKYDATEITGTVYYSEAENISGMTTSVINNVPRRSSNAKCGYSSEDVTIVNLPVGVYKLTAQIYKNNSGSYTYTFTAGENNVIAEFSQNGATNNSTFTSDEFTLKAATDIVLKGGTSEVTCVDYIYIQKTGDYVAPDPNVGEHYFYSAADGKFLSRGADYGTRAIADNYGVPANVVKNGEVYNIQFLDNELYLGSDGYADKAINAANINTTWTLETVEGGFKLKNGNGSYAKITDGFVNIDGTAETATVWSFKTIDEQKAIVAATQQANIVSVATANGWNDVTTTDAFTAKVAEELVVQDQTALIKSATAGNIDDWVYTQTQATGQYNGYNTGNYGAELFRRSGYVSQTITVPEAGIYKLTLNAFYREGNNAICQTLGAKGYNMSNAYVSINDTYFARIPDWYSEADGVNPDNTGQAKTAFEAGKYAITVYAYVGNEKELTIKLHQPNWVDACWMLFNNFALTYYAVPAGVAVESVSLDKTSATIALGDAPLTLTATVSPDDADDKNIIWTSSDETVATVANGVVTALNAGTATITATSNADDTKKATCNVTVTQAAAPSFYSEIAAGDFYIMNVATGKFLGGDNAWGTQASLIKHGIPFTAALNDGKYTLDSHTYNDANNHFLNGVYVDQPATNLYITSLGSGKYSISTADGSAFISAKGGTTVVDNTAANANSSLAQWYFISKNDRDKMLADATAENPVDATYYIPNASFSRNQNTSYNEKKWTVTAANSNLAANENCAESYRSSNGFNVTQTITVPNGTYRFRAQGFYRQDGEDNVNKAVFFIGDKEIEFPERTGSENNMALARASFDAGLYYTDWTEVTVTDHTLTLGARTSNTMLWCIWDNFELEMIGYTPVTEIAATVDKSEIMVTKTAQITPTVTPAAASFNVPVYTSSNEAVATVDANGVVTGVSSGNATITIAGELETSVSTTVDITVTFDLSTLYANIQTANALNAKVTNGVSTLAAAITTAQAVYDNPESQAAIDAAATTLGDAITAAEAVVTARLQLAGVAKKADALKGFIDTDITTDITAASEYAINAEATADEANAKIDALNANFSSWEIVEINNGGFDTEADWQTGNVAAVSAANSKAVTDWTSNGGAGWCSSAAFGYGGNGQINGVAVPATDMYGQNTGGMLGFSLGWGSTVKYTQNVALPVGKYVLYYEAYNSSADNSTIGTNLIGLNGTNSSAINFGTKTWNAYATDVISVNPANAEAILSVGGTANSGVGSGGSAKFVIDNVTIFKIEGAATSSDYATLATAIETAEGNTLGFEVGEYAPYNNIDAITALNAAKAIDQKADNYQSAVQAATAALEAATWTANATEVNAIYDGDFAIQIVDGNNTKPLGWNRSSTVASVTGENTATQVRLLGIPEGVTASNKGMLTKFHSFYGEADGYTLPLKAETTYKFTFKYGGWSDCNNQNAHLNIYDPTGAQLSVNLPKNFNTPDKNCNSSAEGWHDYEGYFTTTTAGNYVIGIIKDGGNSSQNQFGFTEFELKKAVADEIIIAENTDYTPALKYADVTFKRSLVQGWNGLVLPFDMTVENVATTFKASKVKNFIGITYDPAKGVTLNFDNFDSETTVIPAGTPFLVKVGENPAASYEFNGMLLPATGLQNIKKTADANIQYTMKGTYAATTELTNVSFALIQGNTFFYHDGAAAKTSSAKAFRAYFENESTNSEGARVSFDFGDDETTGITELAQPKTAADGTAYDLQGRKVETFKQKGIYIVNGRKVVK